MLENKEPQKFIYMMLSRLQSDCEYFLGAGKGSVKCLWAGGVEEQIKEMQQQYELLVYKPEWLSQKDIENYKIKMGGK